MTDSPGVISLAGYEKYSRGVIGCQCDVEVRQHALSAPVWRDLLEADGGPRFLTAPAARDCDFTKHQYPVKHIYVVFKSPLKPGEFYKKVFPVDTLIRVIKVRLASVLHLSPDNLLLTRNRTIIKDSTLLGDLKYSSQCTIVFDVYTKDSEPFSLADISMKADVEEVTGDVKNKDDGKDKQFVAIKFKVPAQNSTFTRSYHTNMMIHEVKKNLAALFGIDHDNLVMMRGDKVLKDRMMLQEIDYDRYGNVDAELITRDSRPVNLDKLYKEKYMNDVITVVVPFGATFKYLNVEIFSEPIKKPYLGGFRNKLNDKVYHHAFTQTPQRPERLPPEDKACRDTQTAAERDRKDDTAYSRATQMARDGCFVPNVTDRVVTARNYETHEAMVARLNHAHYATVIQRACRHWLFRRKVREFLDVCAERIARMKEEDRLEEEEMARRLRKDLITKTFPKTREDFDQLYAMVDHWMQAEIARISSLHSKGPKIAAYTLLLDKEVELLRCIEEYRVKVREDYRKLKEKTFLESISKPITWFGYNGKLVAMDTIEIQKARKFKELYSNFLRSDMDVKERLELLVDMKYSLQGFDHKLTDELVYLLDQEADLLVRRCSSHQLEFLRRRLAATLVRFIKTSELNSNITKLKDVRDYRNMEGDRLHLCHYCNEMKPYTDFPLYTKMSSFLVCTSCSWKDPGERMWIDMTPYKFILKAVQREERYRRCWGSLAFVLREKDIFFIVEKIWHAHSAVSECSDVTELRLCRWHKNEDWSPWNCFLVTVQEMKAHLKLEEPERVYDEELVQRVVRKHKLAKAQFEQLLEVNKRFTESGDWHAIRAPATSYLPSVAPV